MSGYQREKQKGIPRFRRRLPWALTVLVLLSLAAGVVWGRKARGFLPFAWNRSAAATAMATPSLLPTPTETPSPTETPTPTATFTPSPTPTPEATPTPDAAAIVQRIQEKIEAQFGVEQFVNIYRKFNGRQAGKYTVAFVTGEMMKWLGIAPELRVLLDQGADVTVVLYARNLGYYIRSTGQIPYGLKAAFCVPLRQGAISPVLGDERKVTPLDATARTYLAVKSNEYRDTTDFLGIRGTDAKNRRWDQPGLASGLIVISWEGEEKSIFLTLNRKERLNPTKGLLKAITAIILFVLKKLMNKPSICWSRNSRVVHYHRILYYYINEAVFQRAI